MQFILIKTSRYTNTAWTTHFKFHYLKRIKYVTTNKGIYKTEYNEKLTVTTK